MSNLRPDQVTSRSDSDLLVLEMIAQNTSMSTPARMALIAERMAEWDRATSGSTGRLTAEREAAQRKGNGTAYAIIRNY